MSNHELPGWLRTERARGRDRQPLEVRDDWPRFPRIGDLRVAQPTRSGRSDPRLVLVIGLDPEGRVEHVGESLKAKDSSFGFPFGR